MALAGQCRLFQTAAQRPAPSAQRPAPEQGHPSIAKTYKTLIGAVSDFSSLQQAYQRARRGKRDHADVQRFEQNLEGQLFALQRQIESETYRTGAYRTFYVHEPKRRLVAALPFRDRVLQHSLVATLEPIWEREFISHSYACRPGKGLHAGTDTAEHWLRALKRQSSPVYALRTDIAAYFASIDHQVLIKQLQRRIACSPTLALCSNIVDSWPNGLPIGNLTSQLWANIYLHDLDRFIKHQLRAKHYARYMDDTLILSHDKAQLQRHLAAIAEYLADTLHLQLNRKTQIFPVAGTTANGRALDWLGYRIWPTHRRLRRDSVKRMMTGIDSLQRDYAAGRIPLSRVSASINSWIGHASHASTHRLLERWLADAVFQLADDGALEPR